MEFKLLLEEICVGINKFLRLKTYSHLLLLLLSFIQAQKAYGFSCHEPEVI